MKLMVCFILNQYLSADPESELSIARTRICELESVVETQKTEVSKHYLFVYC